MDGLLIDSEPLWDEAAHEVLIPYGIKLTTEQYTTTKGLRTKEFIHWWFTYFKLPLNNINTIEQDIINKVTGLIMQKGKPMQGLTHILNFFTERNFKIGLASSSPQSIIDVVLDLLNLKDKVHKTTSAANLQYGKPHPEVYLNCASELNVHPAECICFEDSFNGMIAAKAARMKCIVVPDHKTSMHLQWNAADLKISSLTNFNDLLLQSL